MKPNKLLLCPLIILLLLSLTVSGANASNITSTMLLTSDNEKNYPYNDVGVRYFMDEPLKSSDSWMTGPVSYDAAPGDMLKIKIQGLDADQKQANWTITLRDGRIVEGSVLRQETGWFDYNLTYSMDGVSTTIPYSKFWIVSENEYLELYYYINDSAGFYAINYQDCGKGPGILVPVNDLNDTIVAFTSNSNMPIHYIIEEYDQSYFSTDKMNDPFSRLDSIGWWADFWTMFNLALKFANDMFTIAASVIETVFFIYYVFSFFFTGETLLLLILIIELGAAAYYLNMSKNIFKAIGGFFNVNYTIVQLLMFLIPAMINFFFMLAEAAIRFAEIFIRIIEVGAKFLGDVLGVLNPLKLFK